jgi:hypothetical protein
MCHDAVLSEQDSDIASVYDDGVSNNVQCGSGVIGMEGSAQRGAPQLIYRPTSKPVAINLPTEKSMAAPHGRRRRVQSC